MTATPELEKAVLLIRKLLAKATGAAQIGNAAEAAAFAAKANELLLRHKLEMSELETVSDAADEMIIDDYVDTAELSGTPSTKNRSNWLEALAAGIARAHFCRILVIPGSKSIRLIGKNLDRTLVLYLFGVLARHGHRLGDEYTHKVRREARERGLPMPAKPRAAFLIGYVTEIRARLVALRQEVTTAGGQYAVVRFQAAENAVTLWMKQHVPTRPVGGLNRQVSDRAGYEAGRLAGRNVNLTPGVGDGARKTGTLTAGQLRIGGAT